MVGLEDVELKPEIELLHEYVLPATGSAPIATEDPEQIVVPAITEAAGIEVVMVTVLELVHPFEFFSVRVYVTE
jgi:hypothetical protein